MQGYTRRPVFIGQLNTCKLCRLTAAVVYRYQSFWHVSSCLLPNICKSRVVRTFSNNSCSNRWPSALGHSNSCKVCRPTSADSSIKLFTAEHLVLNRGKRVAAALTRRGKFWNALRHPSSCKVCRWTSVDSSVKLFTAEHLQALKRGKRVAAALTRREKFWNALGDRDWQLQ